MRVIAGKARGTKLFSLEGLATRPTLDRVKEALFNMIAGNISDAIVCDFFAGSGSLCIEALSRGAQKAYFFDKSQKAIGIIEKNLTKTNLKEQAVVRNYNHLRALEYVRDQKLKLDIVFLDPPHFSEYATESLEKIFSYDLLAEDGIIIIEHHRDETFPQEVGYLVKTREKTYGITTLTFFRRTL